MMFFRMTLPASETAINLEAGESDDLALGAGCFGPLEEFVNQKASMALVSPVAAVDGKNFHFILFSQMNSQYSFPSKMVFPGPFLWNRTLSGQ
jgi:hypothetical protein